MKILFIFTGGTIGSTAGDGFIGTDKGKPYKLIEMYRERYGIDFEYDTVEPYTILSEYSSGETITKLIECVREFACCGTDNHMTEFADTPGKTKSFMNDLRTGTSNEETEEISDGGGKERYDGIIVTHGTDTLQYSATALGIALGDDTIPVCLVSSNYPVEDKRANGLVNMHAAVTFIREGLGHGVWVVYKNAGEGVKVHRGTAMLPGRLYSDYVESLGCCGEFVTADTGAVDDPGYSGRHDISDSLRFVRNDGSQSSGSLKLFTRVSEVLYNEPVNKGRVLIPDTVEHVLRIQPYPGMRYPDLTDEIRYVLHETYHSGTINTESEDFRRFMRETSDRGVPVYLVGVSSSATAYDSMRVYEDFGIRVLPDMSPITAYLLLWMGIEPDNV